MRIAVWTDYGPQNSKDIFAKFITSLKKAGEDVRVNEQSNADVAVIWSVLWRGRMEQYRRIWNELEFSFKKLWRRR